MSLTTDEHFEKLSRMITSEMKTGGDFIRSLSQEVLAELYGLFKVATCGPCPSDRSAGFLDFEGKAKLEAWRNASDRSAKEAKREYVKKASVLMQRYLESAR